MKNLLPAIAVLLCSISLQAQTKKGFKYLDQKKYEQALGAFAKDTAAAELQAAAYYGMAKALLEQKQAKTNYRQLMEYQTLALQAWDSLKTPQKTPLTRSYKVSRPTIESIASKAETACWEAIQESSSLFDFDTYLDLFPKSPTYKKKRAQERQVRYLDAAVDSAASYSMLGYLYNQHFEAIGNRSYRQQQLLGQRLFSAFLNEKGVQRLNDFSKENPSHPLANDPAAPAFQTAWTSSGLRPLITFLMEFPQSGFAPYVHQKGTELLQASPLSPTDRKAYSAKEQLILKEMEWTAEGNKLDLNSPFSEDQKIGWLLYLQRNAPGREAFSISERMYKFYMKNRDWASAAEILRTGSTLFPRESDWFSERLGIVERPDSGSVPVPVSQWVNSTGDEYSPILTADGKRLFFGGKDRSDNISGEDVYTSILNDTGWTSPVVVKELSGAGNQVPVSITGDGNQILIFNNGQPYQSDRTATGWTTMKPLPGVTGFTWVGLVQIASNNQVMLLEAQDYNTEQIDIFVLLRDQTGAWGEPIRLDTTINTSGNDRTPFLHPDLRTLYYSSDGRPGLGELDVFVSKRLDDTWLRWSQPENMGKYVNTPGSDWSYRVSTDGSIAWFGTLTEEQGEDLFFVKLPESKNRADTVNLIEILVKGEDGKPITEGNLIVKDAITGKITGSFRLNPEGKPTVLTLPVDRQYLITLEKEGYYPQSVPIQKLASGQSPKLEMEWKAPRLATGITRNLNIFFDFGAATLRPESNAELQQIAGLNKKQGYRIKLTGHTDNVGSPAANLDLSQRRAESARDALIALGVPADQIEAHGKGETVPVVANDTEENRAQNRRVVIELLGK